MVVYIHMKNVRVVKIVVVVQESVSKRARLLRNGRTSHASPILAAPSHSGVVVMHSLGTQRICRQQTRLTMDKDEMAAGSTLQTGD